MELDLISAGKNIDAQVANHIKNLEHEIQSLEIKLEEEQRIAQEASAQGDRSENAEWQIANDNAARLTVTLTTLLNTVDRYKRTTSSYHPTGRVEIGSTVKLHDRTHQSVLYVKIYPPGLGNAKLGAISSATPVGTAIMGKTPGTEVIVNAPVGNITYYIEEVL